MQCLMKDLITDLALHYNLSQKQVRFLSESQHLLGLTDMSLGESRLSEVTSFRLSDMSLNELHNLPHDSQKMSPIPHMSSCSPINDSQLTSQIERNESLNLKQGPLCDSQSVSRLTQPGAITPNRSIISLDELSNLLSEGTFKSSPEGTEEVIRDLRMNKVRLMGATREQMKQEEVNSN